MIIFDQKHYQYSKRQLIFIHKRRIILLNDQKKSEIFLFFSFLFVSEKNTNEKIVGIQLEFYVYPSSWPEVQEKKLYYKFLTNSNYGEWDF